MRTDIKEKKFEAWRHGLLDISRRNKLMNYRKTKRTTLQITVPDMDELFRQLVIEGDSLTFRRQISIEDDRHLVQLFYIMDKMGAPVELAEGEIRSDLSLPDMNQTLKNLRARAKLSLEEQGINILYLSFGFLRWKQKQNDDEMLSPLVLVPVSLERESIASPYRMKRLEEDIVVNPTLEYALAASYGISLPEYELQEDDLEAYLSEVAALVSSNGWAVQREASLGLLSFLKIVMYKDLEKYKTRIFSNPVIKAFCGDTSALPAFDPSIRDFAHDRVPPLETCQVVNADASQQDAILLSRQGVSFVLQGPPGTGKSQTITNIIAQALADRKKVLFVSEKTAALNVVFRRLEEVGLADYCLSLHNYKAERRAVIQDLVDTLDAPTSSIKSGVTDALAVLEEERTELNSYFEELNQLRKPLNTTIYDAVTEIAAAETGYTFSAGEEVASLTEEGLKERTMLLKQLGVFLEENGYEIYVNPWRGTSIDVVTYDLRNRITGELRDAEPVLFGLTSTLTYLNRNYGCGTEWTLNGFRELLGGVAGFRLAEAVDKKVSAASPFPLTGEGCRLLKEKTDRLNACCARAGNLDLPCETLPDDAAIAGRIAAVREKEMQVRHCAELIEKVNSAFPVQIPDNRAGLEQSCLLAKAADVPWPVMGVWFREGQYEELMDQVREWKRLTEEMTGLKNGIDAVWEKEFYDLDYSALIDRYSSDYRSFFRRLGSSYRRDRSLMASLRRDMRKKVTDQECLSGLENLKRYYEIRQTYLASEADAQSLLGSLYQGGNTDWEKILQILGSCEPVNAYAKRYGISNVLLLYLENPHEQRQERLAGAMPEHTFGSLLEALAAAAGRSDSGAPYSEQLTGLHSAESCLEDLRGAYAESGSLLSAFCAESGRMPDSVGSVRSELNALTAMAEALADLKDSAVKKIAAAGLTEEEIPALEELFEEYVSRENLASEAGKLADLVFRREAEPFAAQLSRAAESIVIPLEHEDILTEYLSWFPDMDLAGLPLHDLTARIQGCRDVELLQKWIRYAAVERECIDRNMGDYLEFIERNRVKPEEIVPAYRKSVLSKWLIDLIAEKQVPCFLNFQSYAHEKTISEFAENDGKQLQIAKARLLDQLSHEKPSGTNQLVSAMDEVSILRREAEKKRRVMPLRKLFKTMPTLLQKLKPCFMMSPLSVAYFLDSELYSFDMVIFDEASQILPEDAVGAIYRGKQAIIVGDTKQMPPTSFFSAAAQNEDEFDIDEDSEGYYPDIVSESVLDEANTCLPSCTLLWHYRSRDESLIAFSNRQIYNGSLITFPSPARLEDRGLEYVYVPDGCYEGSGRNCNVKEAEKCLELVIEHIRRYPERSLGIVAFSEKQQTVIEDVIIDYRLKNPMYETFFDESRDEPFFVKNLENVQGDERDTIIFSICYAKNSQGRMYQRFGPLGLDGGERRLNVAVTRAKYNVKLVGSILPTDIVIREATKDGVRLLREYIDYAMQNSFALAVSAGSGRDEPFADSIAAFLQQRGFRCARDVGASRYKVDIGVYAEGKSDAFLAGIECDGSNYTNARTARDRDVLRRSVMSALGWKLYHVWSVGWFLSPEDERRRLLEFLTACMTDSEALPDGARAAVPDGPEPEEDVYSDVRNLVDSEDRSGEVNTLCFPPYEYADPWDAPCLQGDDDYTVLAKRILWVVEREQPIHTEELYRRLAAVFGRQKVTAPVRRTVDDCIAGRLKNRLLIRDGFVYLQDAEILARSAKPGEEPREIEYISPEEIQTAMCEILTFAYGLSRQDLINETARQLGYARVGPKISDTMEAACRQLCEDGRIQETDGRLYCAGEVKK